MLGFPIQWLSEISGRLALQPLKSGSESNVASVDITLPDGFKTYLFAFDDLLPVTDNQYLRIRTSSDGGSTFDSGASDYQSNAFGLNSASATLQVNQSNAVSLITPCHLDQCGNAAGEEGAGIFLLHNPFDTGLETMITGEWGYQNEVGNLCRATFAALRQSAAVVNAFQLFYGSGNVSTAEWSLYGLRKA